jgi:hypothetical protein
LALFAAAAMPAGLQSLERVRRARPQRANQPSHHGFHFMKLASNRKPSLWLFSGWN